MRSRVVFAILVSFPSLLAFAADSTAPSKPSAPALRGVVADPTGAIVPGAQVDLVDPSGTVAGTNVSDGEGNFLLTAPHAGAYTLVVSEPGFETVRTPVEITPGLTASAPAAAVLAKPMHIVLPIAALATNIHVNADTNEDLTAPEENRDSSVLTSSDLKQLPIFDNDYQSAMSSFLDDNVTATGGTGLLVDGVESNRATVSASAVQEVRINSDPYSAQYYWPGRGQMEIITKSAADRYHGQFNFLFRDSGLNAQNALAPSKPFEQRRIYEGHVTGPIWHAPKSSFLASFNRAEEDLDSVVNATLLPTPENPTGAFSANVPAPNRDTEFSLRAAHQFSDKHSAYAQYAYQDWTGQDQGVGGQTLAAGGYNTEYVEHDLTLHVDSTLSASMLNQLSLVGEYDSSRNTNTAEAPRVSVTGDFNGGSAQSDSLATEDNARLFDMVSWTHGRHYVKAGISIPHMGRRAFDDNTNALGTYTFGPTLAADGVTVIKSAIENYRENHPSGYSLNSGDVHFIYHRQEVGGFVQDQFKLNSRFSVTPGVRYDWQNFLANNRLGLSPRVSFAWVLDQDSKLVVRGGGGIYYDRFGGGPLLDLVRYEDARRNSVVLSLDPTTESPAGCVPITSCVNVAGQPVSLARLQANAKTPYQIQYGLSIERQLGEKATAVVSAYSVRGVDEFRSVDINAPTPESGYTERPNPRFSRVREMQPEGFFEGNAMDISYRGRLNKYFTGFGRYTWSHYESNTSGIGWFPQNQYAPNDEWSNASFDRRHRLGMYAMFDPDSIFNLGAGIFVNTGTPWTVLTGTDAYGDGLFNTRPDGVGRDTENNPTYVDLDLRWGHDFHITPSKDEEAPRLGFSAGAFNVLNHVNGTSVDPVETSSEFGQVTAVAPPRRIQLGMRFEF